MPNASLKIDHARYVVTLDPERRIIRDGTIFVEDGRIQRVGKAAELADARADRVIDGRLLLVTPGFVNGHMHISYAHPVRGIFPDACLQAYQDSGIRVVMGECVTDREAPWPLPRYATDEAATRTAAFIDRWDGRLDGRLTAWAMPFSYETCTAELLRALKQVVDQRGTSLTLHHNSGPRARKEAEARYGASPTAYLAALGVLGPNVVLAHALGLDDAEMDCLARTGTAVAMCPVTAAKGGRGIPEHGRMPELLGRGVKIALGCDSPNNSNHLDIVRAMNMAAIQYKDARQDMRQVPAETALEMATLTGAQAIGLGDTLGSIEPGKKADLVLFDTQRPEWQALHNPINNLVYNADGRSIHTVVVDGRVVVDAYRQSFVDEARLFEAVQEIGEQLQARTGITFPRSRWPIV